MDCDGAGDAGETTSDPLKPPEKARKIPLSLLERLGSSPELVVADCCEGVGGDGLALIKPSVRKVSVERLRFFEK